MKKLSAPGPPILAANGRDALPFEQWPVALCPDQSLIEEGYALALGNADPRPVSNRADRSQFLRVASLDVPTPSLPISRKWVVTFDSVRLQWQYPSRMSRESLSVSAPEYVSSLVVVWDRLDTVDCSLPWTSRTGSSSYKIGAYAKTITFTDALGGTATVLLGLYGPDSHEPLPVVVLDVNPSKCSSGLLEWCLRCCSAGSVGLVQIKRYDLAIDMPVDRSSAYLMPVGGRHYCKIISSQGATTEYIGQRQHGGYIKLYDKAAESGLSGPLTRLELTLTPDMPIPLEVPECVVSDNVQMQIGKVSFDVLACILFPSLLPLLKASVSPNTWTTKKRLIKDYQRITFAFDPDDHIYITKFVNGWLNYFRRF